MPCPPVGFTSKATWKYLLRGHQTGNLHSCLCNSPQYEKGTHFMPTIVSNLGRENYPSDIAQLHFVFQFPVGFTDIA